jgi:hypothetical protein
VTVFYLTLVVLGNAAICFMFLNYVHFFQLLIPVLLKLLINQHSPFSNQAAAFCPTGLGTFDPADESVCTKSKLGWAAHLTTTLVGSSPARRHSRTASGNQL